MENIKASTNRDPSKHVGRVVDLPAIHSLVYSADNDIRSMHN